MFKEKKILGIIPARGGSKGIKRKNLVELGGKPLIQYTIEECFNSKHLTNFLVSTDDREIINFSKYLNSWVPFIRPKEISTDISDSKDVALHALNYVNSVGHHYDYLMLLQPTTPFRSSSMIDEAIEMIIDKKSDALVSIIDVGANHPFRMYSINNNNKIEAIYNSENPMLARQHLPKFYIRSGDIYLIKTDVFREKFTFLPKNTLGFIIDENKHINIDTPLDLKIAELLLSNK